MCPNLSRTQWKRKNRAHPPLTLRCVYIANAHLYQLLTGLLLCSSLLHGLSRWEYHALGHSVQCTFRFGISACNDCSAASARSAFLSLRSFLNLIVAIDHWKCTFTRRGGPCIDESRIPNAKRSLIGGCEAPTATCEGQRVSLQCHQRPVLERRQSISFGRCK